ncbi:hypothetical protein RchiOBHm_Chr1g0341111 [Rosa chinensis]|uniref:Uncharacterized protein n=1 Tax=Rosa chinensis TaxID=74649 RepID=A0A2P6SDM3_ROSCH|nr:hypothetical protein RchiOBHm_Chr1g0341111 [Rosa chinensis]
MKNGGEGWGKRMREQPKGLPCFLVRRCCRLSLIWMNSGLYIYIYIWGRMGGRP